MWWCIQLLLLLCSMHTSVFGGLGYCMCMNAHYSALVSGAQYIITYVKNRYCRIGITSANICFERPITAILHNISFHTLIVHNHHYNNNKVLTLTPSGFLGCVNMKSKVVSMFAIFMAALKRKTIQGSYCQQIQNGIFCYYLFFSSQDQR